MAVRYHSVTAVISAPQRVGVMTCAAAILSRSAEPIPFERKDRKGVSE